MSVLKVDNKLIHTPIIDILHRIQRECHNGKLASIRNMGTDIQVSCPNPNHKGGHEAKPSGGVYTGENSGTLTTGLYHCLACDVTCSFPRFVAMCFECSEDTAKNWLIDNYADDSIDYTIDLPPIESIALAKTQKNVVTPQGLQDFHPYMTVRKLSADLCARFEVKYDPLTECLIFPVRDERGNLTMFTRRSVKEKKFIIDKDKEKPLYLLRYALQDNPTKFMITEGQIDAITAYGYGIPCVATMGAISDHQIDLLNHSGVRVLYLMFDNDDAGRRFENKLICKLRKDILTVPVHICIPGKKDINDLTKDEFNQCVKYAEINCI